MKNILNDKTYPYPRICAHRGWSGALPENTLPAYGAAVALGADEIEMDLYSTTDGVIVSCHDFSLERVSDGEGLIFEHTYEELLKYDFGVKFGTQFTGLKILKFEDILREFAHRVIMNIHVKIWDFKYAKENPWGFEFPDDKMDEIVALIKKYDNQDYVYFMTCPDDAIKKVKERYPEMRCCIGHDKKRPLEHVNRAIQTGAEKVQLTALNCTKEMIEEAHKYGIIVNFFESNNPDEAMKYLDMGVDCLLTDNFLAVKNAFDERNNK